MNFTMTPEQVASLDALLKIIATPQAAKKRLDELVAQTVALKAAEQEFISTQSIADIRAELASRENALNVRLAAADVLEADRKAQRDAIAAVLAS